MSPRVRLAIRWAVGLAVLGLLVAFVDLGGIAARLSRADLRLAVPAIGGLVLVHVIAAGAWRRLLRELAGVSLGWAATLRLYYTAQLVGTFTPANVGADVYRVVAVGGGASRAQLAQPVLVQRLTSIVALVCFGIAGALALRIAGLGPFVAAVAVVGASVALVSLAVASPTSAPGWVARLAGRVGWAAVGTASSNGRLRSALRDGLGLGLVFHGTSLLLGLVLVRAVDPATSAEPWLVLGALAVARLSLAVPLSPNGIGIQEGLLAILFVQLGLPAETALAAALLNRIAFIATALVGLAGLASPARSRAPVFAGPSQSPAPATARPSARAGR
jgi:uncharacterized membrane protein YbhN (UPF0104 family)